MQVVCQQPCHSLGIRRRHKTDLAASPCLFRHLCTRLSNRLILQADRQLVLLAEEIRKDRKKVTKNDAALRLASALHKVSALFACSMSIMLAAAAEQPGSISHNMQQWGMSTGLSQAKPRALAQSAQLKVQAPVTARCCVQMSPLSPGWR